VSFVLGLAFRSGGGCHQLQKARSENRRLDLHAERNLLSSEELRDRHESAQKDSAQLEHSLLELPEIAQRLSATRSMIEIPEAALDLVEEIYKADYCTYYKMGEGGLVAVSSRGKNPPPLGHRVRVREGVVGWSAIRQMAITSFEVGSMQIDTTKAPIPPFALCLPVVNGRRTLGVILIGPCARELPRAREIGRTIALITAVTIAHTLVLRQQAILAKTDGLTGLLNRSHALGQLEKFIAQPTLHPRISLFLFDVDHFKQYNDTNGHLAGDELLKRLAVLLKQSVRDVEFVGRYGGEEFLMVMPGIAGEDALRASDRIRELIEGQDFANAEGQPLGAVTVSGGVATWPDDGATSAEVLQHADEALYKAKRAGRNKVVAFERTPARVVEDSRQG